MLQEKLATIKVKEIVRKLLIGTSTQAEIFQLREWDKQHDLSATILMRKAAILEMEEFDNDTETYLIQLDNQSKQALEKMVQEEHNKIVTLDLQETQADRLTDETFVTDLADVIAITSTTLLGRELL